MLLETDDADKRLNSPNNLMNRLKALKSTKTSLPFDRSERKHPTHVIPNRSDYDPLADDDVIINSAGLVTVPPSITDLVDNIEAKLMYSKAHEKALAVLVKSLDYVSDHMDEIDKPERVANLASEMNKIIHVMAISKTQKNTNQVNIQIYAPSHRDERSYDIVQVND